MNPKCRGLWTTIVVALSVVMIGGMPTLAEQNSKTQINRGKIYFDATIRFTDADGKQTDMEGIFEVDPKSGAWRKLLDRGHGPRVSPDGETLAFSDGGKLWSCDTKDALSPGRLAESTGRISWKPDSKHLVFSTGDRKSVV